MSGEIATDLDTWPGTRLTVSLEGEQQVLFRFPSDLHAKLMQPLLRTLFFFLPNCKPSLIHNPINPQIPGLCFQSDVTLGGEGPLSSWHPNPIISLTVFLTWCQEMSGAGWSPDATNTGQVIVLTPDQSPLCPVPRRNNEGKRSSRQPRRFVNEKSRLRRVERERAELLPLPFTSSWLFFFFISARPRRHRAKL